MKQKTANFLIIFFLIFFDSVHSQNKDLEILMTENFNIRSFAFSNFHYFSYLSYNHQTIYIKNIVHPKKSLIIFSSENDGVKTMSFSSNEKKLASGSNSGLIEIWDFDSQKLEKSLKIHQGAVNKVKFIPEKDILISAGNDGNIFIINLSNNENCLLGRHKSVVRDFDYEKKNEVIVSISSDQNISLWDISKNYKIKSTLLTDAFPTSVKFVPYFQRIIVGDSNGFLHLFDMNLNLLKKINIHTSIITSINVTGENEIITTSFDGSIKKLLWSNLKIEEVYSNKYYIINAEVHKKKIIFSNVNGELIQMNLKINND